jgi:general secretion pathway protein G
MSMKKRCAFTLIELLIVVAIIGILAAIAVPNFLNAQIRARASRGKADINTMEKTVMLYIMDNNQRPIDFDDPGGAKYLGGLRAGDSKNGAPNQVKSIPEWGGAPAFMSFSQLRIFSTPISYITSTNMRDVFCSGCALTYNTRYSGFGGQAESFTFSVMGPDGMTGDWAMTFFFPQQYPYGIQYDSSNGMTSRGDIFVSNIFSDAASSRDRGGRLGFN